MSYTIDGSWDERGFMKPGAENGILFSLEHYMLCKKAHELNRNQETLNKRVIAGGHLITAMEYVTRNGDISYFDGEGTWSHDNHTALTSASFILDMDYHKRLDWHGWYRRIHPRDLGYYLSLRYPAFKRVLLIPTQIAMIVSCYQEYKTRNGNTMLKTDGKLLAWVRFNTIKMPITRKICNWLIKRNPKFGSWKNVFTIYFGLDHPSSQLDEKIYNI